MRQWPSRLRRLDDALFDLPDDAMLLSELDGYLTGIALSAEPVTPGEWLPGVWRGGPSPYEEPGDADWFAGMVAARLAEVARDLARGRPQPIFDTDPRTGDLMWESWIEGFALAQALRPDAWAGEGAAEADALAGLATLHAVATGDTALESHEVNALHDVAGERIVAHVAALADRRATPAAAPVRAKVGRNDPCPCGSGAKHKRCCGAAAG